MFSGYEPAIGYVGSLGLFLKTFSCGVLIKCFNKVSFRWLFGICKLAIFWLSAPSYILLAFGGSFWQISHNFFWLLVITKKTFPHNKKSPYKMDIDIQSHWKFSLWNSKSFKALTVFCSDQHSEVFQSFGWGERGYLSKHSIYVRDFELTHAKNFQKWGNGRYIYTI